MALDASSELYILPFKPPVENRFQNLCKSGASICTSNDVSKELLEIRITEIPQDLDGDMMLQSGMISDNSGNDFGSVMRHQEIDFDSLNQILYKDVVLLSSAASEDPKLGLGPDTLFGEVKNISSVPVIMLSKDDAAQDMASDAHDILSDDLKYSNHIKEDKNLSDFIVYKDDSDVLNSVEVLGVDSMESIENVWISDECPEPLPEVGLDTSQLLEDEPINSHLIPVKLEDDVVFIDAAPSSTGPKTDKPSVTNGSSTGTPTLERPTVISIAVPNGDANGSKRMQTRRKSHLTMATQKPANVRGFDTSQGISGSVHSRSVLKTSFAKKGSKYVPLKPKLSGKQAFKEEHFTSLINQGSKQMDQNILMRKSSAKVSKGRSNKTESLAVVAISSDKTKDLTEIVLSTARGEQIFKGKTSELISATPNLWCDDSSQSSEGNTMEDDDFLYQPVTDALQRLGVPAWSWVQNKGDEHKLWYCPEKGCKKQFSLLNQLKVHILGHYGVRPYKCDFPNCQWAFYTHFKLKRHKETHLQRKDYKCSFPECGRSFTTVYNLKTHQKLHKRPAEICCPVKDCSELFQTRRSLEFHLKEHGSDHAPYVCPYASCQKRYYTVNSVNSHIRSHQHKDDEIRCQWSGCSKVFSKPCRLRAHMRTHTGDKPYLCTHPGCNWAFTSSSKLRRHQFKHTNTRNFQCPIEGCGKLFMRSEHLKEHALTHSSERTFHCPHPNCNMKFSAKSSLYVHSKKHRAKFHAVTSGTIADAVTSIPVKVIQSTRINTSPTTTSNLCTISSMNIEDQIAVQGLPTEANVQPEGTRALDFIPLLAEDEALVAELANMEPVIFEHAASPSLVPTEASLSPEVNENSASVGLPGFIDESNLHSASSIPQVLICAQDIESNQSTAASERDDDIGPVLNPGSARSSITIHSWARFKKARQSQALPLRHVRQPKRQAQPLQRFKKSMLLSSEVEVDPSQPIIMKQANQDGLSNVRAPLDVVLGGGYLGSGPDSIAHLLLPDELATSADLYSSEDTILTMDTSFVPSTINLRDLE